MPNQWYYKLLGEEFGPVPFENVVELVQNNHLSPEDELRQGNEGTWTPAGSIVGLFPEESQTATVPTAGAPQADFHFADSSDEIPATDDNTQTEEQWFCELLGQELGPFPLDELVRMARNGELSPEDPVKSTAQDRWMPLQQVPQLRPAVEASQAQQQVENQHPAAQHQHASAATSTSSPNQNTLPLNGNNNGSWYYCWIGGTEYGPVGVNDLQRWIAENRITAQDYVRMASGGGWFQAASIPQLFRAPAATPQSTQPHQQPNQPISSPSQSEQTTNSPSSSFAKASSNGTSTKPAPSTGSSTPNQAAGREASPSSAPVEQPTKSKKEETPKPSSKPDTPAAESQKTDSSAKNTTSKKESSETTKPTPKPASAPSTGSSSSSSSAPNPLPPAPVAKPRQASKAKKSSSSSSLFDSLGLDRINFKIVAAVVGAALVASAFFFLDFGGTSDVENYKTFLQIWRELDSKRQADASSDEWSRFVSETNKKVDPIVTELKETAGPEVPAKQHLLWAGRDYLPRMLQDSRTEASDAEIQFVKHMEEARKLLNLSGTEKISKAKEYLQKKSAN